MKRLGVNIDHVATLRNARNEAHPSPLKAAKLAIKYGADSITIHLREDRRHIKYLDLSKIKKLKKVPLNLEIATTSEMLKIAIKHKNTRLVIGGYGPEKEICKQMVQSSKELSKTVTFHDVNTWGEIPEVYKKCDILINYASYSPGSGVILSAIASGMGVISSISVNSSRHFVIDKYNGFIIGNEPELFSAMEKYI